VQGSERVTVPNVVKSSVPVVPPDMFVSRAYPQQLTAGYVSSSSLLTVCSRCGLSVHQSELLCWTFDLKKCSELYL